MRSPKFKTRVKQKWYFHWKILAVIEKAQMARLANFWLKLIDFGNPIEFPWKIIRRKGVLSPTKIIGGVFEVEEPFVALTQQKVFCNLETSSIHEKFIRDNFCARAGVIHISINHQQQFPSPTLFSLFSTFELIFLEGRK